ncbi:unnamed protein product [Triticum turgidum subsp. durum]|uniref:glutathione transferase n=1 Tax=Triticum turgidum subsp. durum TaxID=4567 RepID=A0A9R0V6U5_TRITD|nr:unnamed protein product [Triticum turgidum subsp. durum]
MAPAVKVYGWAVSPFVARPLLCLEEAGVDYELVPMSRAAGDHRQPDFLARNPFGQAMVDVWLEVEAHQYNPAVSAIVVQCIILPLLGGARDQAVVDLAGEDISLADLSHFPFTRYFMETEYAPLVAELPHVNAWWEGLKVRPAARKVTELMPPDLGLGKKAE